MVEIDSVFYYPDFVPATVEVESVFTQAAFEPADVTIDDPPNPEIVDNTTAEQKVG